MTKPSTSPLSPERILEEVSTELIINVGIILDPVGGGRGKGANETNNYDDAVSETWAPYRWRRYVLPHP